MINKNGVVHYLLYDRDCISCADLAQLAERVSEGWLEIRSLSDPEMRGLMEKVDPGWPWVPTLLTRRGERVVMRRGVKMFVRILIGLGPRKALKLATAAV